MYIDEVRVRLAPRSSHSQNYEVSIEGETGKKTETTPDVGGKYLSEKFHEQEK